MPRGFPLQDAGPGMSELFHDLTIEQERAKMTTGYEQPGDPNFEGGAAYERYCEEQKAYRNSIIEECAKAALGVPMPRYGTNARFTGRSEMQGWVIKAIRKLIEP